jgi:cbb3-type cytochrome oxidase maturation protein
MSVLYIVLPLALLLAAVAVAAFIWSVRTGQMDDLVTPALRVLHDEVLADPPKRTDAAPIEQAPMQRAVVDDAPAALPKELPVEATGRTPR